MLTLVLLWTGPARGHGQGDWISVPQGDFGIGPGFAYVYGKTHGYAVNLDLSYSWVLFTASLNGKLVQEESAVYGGVQAELTIWLLANLGGGVGYMVGDLEGPIYHWFVGLPIGDDWIPDWMNPFETVYIEP